MVATSGGSTRKCYERRSQGGEQQRGRSPRNPSRHKREACRSRTTRQENRQQGVSYASENFPKHPLNGQHHDPHHDEVFDMDLENICLVHRGSSLQITTLHEHHPNNQHQVDIMHLAESTPQPYFTRALECRKIATHTMPKRRKLEVEEFTANLES